MPRNMSTRRHAHGSLIKKKRVHKSKKEEVMTQRETPSSGKGKDKAFHKGKRESGREKEYVSVFLCAWSPQVERRRGRI